jgi:hypothetical protein
MSLGSLIARVASHESGLLPAAIAESAGRFLHVTAFSTTPV